MESHLQWNHGFNVLIPRQVFYNMCERNTIITCVCPQRFVINMFYCSTYIYVDFVSNSYLQAEKNSLCKSMSNNTISFQECINLTSA